MADEPGIHSRSIDPEVDASARPEGERLGRWGPLEVIEKVGEGGFGETFRAHEPTLERDVALKLLKEVASRDREIAGPVIREGVLLARVNHPNVVTVHGAERHDGRVGLWMEFLRGRTLEELLRREGLFDEREAILIGLDLSRALSAVHAAGIIHRDVKGANVMREESGRIVLMDFGAGLEPEAAGAESVTGTPAYMAPELFRRKPASVRSDLYSLGVLLYHLVTNEYPVTAGTFEDLAQAHRRGEARQLPDVRPDLSPPFVRVVERCLAAEPSERFASASELERSLVDALDAVERTSSVSPATFDFTAWRDARVAEWNRPRFRLDKNFVRLSLLIDQGEEASSGRWSARPERYRDLRELLATVADPAFVLLGPPGSGKSTLLRRLELDVAKAALAGAEDAVTFFVQLNHYKPSRPGEPPPEPGDWLEERWRARFPELPSLGDLIADGRMVLLLDALNEMPAASAAGLREAIVAWKGFLGRLVEEHPGNRVVFSCRTLDYSAPLSTPRLRVPQIVVEPMTDEQVEQYLVKHESEKGAAIWRELTGTRHLEVMRSPYFLSLLLDQVEAAGEIPKGHAGLFTGFIRRALLRELERDNPLFAPDGLLSDRDVRRVTRWRWKTPWQLPERGALVPKLTDLAFGMQDASSDGGASQVRIGIDDALELLDDERSEDVLRAGVALSVLDEDAANDEVLFFHQLLQEYFAGRKLAVSPEPERVRAPWETREIRPPLREMLAALPTAETLPGLPTTGWEETTLLAGVMAEDPDAFLRGLMDANLALAGRCAGQPELRGRLAPDLLTELRGVLVARSTDPGADLRARIEAGLALGRLGDPRLERRRGSCGDYLLPPLVTVPGGRYPVGEDEPFEWGGGTIRSHVPCHEVVLGPFRLGRFPVTNAEWALFQESGGYEEERWWPTPDARRWRTGERTADGVHANVRILLERFRREPGQLEKLREEGLLPEDNYERWRKRLEMTDADLEAHLKTLYPGGKLREPEYWRDPSYNDPAQPVVGVCWFEALAYCNWLSAQTGEPFRLPTEAEWEAAARGPDARSFAYGDEFDALRGNTVETRLKRTTPVGVFTEGESPEGIADLTGNVAQWTSSLFGPGMRCETAPFPYPYRANDGREDLAAGSDVRRVLRGGAWLSDRVYARAAFRSDNRPDSRSYEYGFRLACSGAAASDGEGRSRDAGDGRGRSRPAHR